MTTDACPVCQRGTIVSDGPASAPSRPGEPQLLGNELGHCPSCGTRFRRPVGFGEWEPLLPSEPLDSG
jgi:hypothetical protein